MFDYRAKALAMASIGVLAGVAGCDDPVQGTDLRKEGPPSVTVVMVQTDPRVTTFETATYCKIGDFKRPGFVGSVPTYRTSQVCDEDLTKAAETDGNAQAAPSSWFVRVVFDRLLDPNVEELIPQVDAKGKATGLTIGTFANTQPVSLKCGGIDVPYDGYYVPNGSNLSWPLGPALFIKPLRADSVPTGTNCEISLRNNVTGKKGEAVASTDPAKFLFDVAKFKFLASNPKGSDEAVELDSLTEVEFTFNANVAKTGTVDPTLINLVSKPNLANDMPDNTVCATGPARTGEVAETAYAYAGGRTMFIGDEGAPLTPMQPPPPMDPTYYSFQLGRTYRLEFKAGAIATAKAGGTAPVAVAKPICFYTLSN